MGVPRSGAADPVLRAAELAGILGFPSATLQQAGVHVPKQAQAERKTSRIPNDLEPVHHRVHVVRDLGDVVERLPGERGVLELKEIVERRLRPFDLG